MEELKYLRGTAINEAMLIKVMKESGMASPGDQPVRKDKASEAKARWNRLMRRR